MSGPKTAFSHSGFLTTSTTTTACGEFRAGCVPGGLPPKYVPDTVKVPVSTSAVVPSKSCKRFWKGALVCTVIPDANWSAKAARSTDMAVRLRGRAGHGQDRQPRLVARYGVVERPAARVGDVDRLRGRVRRRPRSAEHQPKRADRKVRISAEVDASDISPTYRHVPASGSKHEPIVVRCNRIGAVRQAGNCVVSRAVCCG